MSRASLSTKTGIPRSDIDAMIDQESNGTAKEDRLFVHDFLLDHFERNEARARSSGADAGARVKAVLDGRGEFATLFSPRDDLKSAILTVIQSASDEILVQAWDLSCNVIAEAIARASAKKIEIAVSAPKGEKLSAALARLARQPNVCVLCDRTRKNHNKTIVVDRKLLLTGSVNFNFMSGGCDENVLVTSRREIVATYHEDFESKRRSRLVEYGAR